MILLPIARATCTRPYCGWTTYAANEWDAAEALAHHLREDHPRMEGSR